jgi:serine/threonine protein kinase
MSKPGTTITSSTSVDALVGKTISDRYLILERLGDGAMGVVYLAEHTLMHKRVAVKVLHREMSVVPEIVARFEREAVAAGHIEHPNVASATDFGKLPDGTFFLVLEYIEGELLRKVISRGRLSLQQAVHIAEQILQGLSRAHSIGIIHRDLKPENIILIERDGDPYFVKILDFGIARVPMGELAKGENGVAVTQAGMIYGTPEYMAPEQALGQDITERSDLYPLGVMLYEMLTGWRPFDADSKVQLLGMHVTAAVPRLSEKAPDVFFPDQIEQLIRDLMAKDERERPSDAKEAIARLKAIEETGRLATTPPQPLLATPPRTASAATRDADRGDSAEVTIPFLGQANLIGAKRKGQRNPTVVALAVLGATLFATFFVIVLNRAFSKPTTQRVDASARATTAAVPSTSVSVRAAATPSATSIEALADVPELEARALQITREPANARNTELAYDALASGILSADSESTLNTWLASDDARAKTSDAVALALDLRKAGTNCAQVKALLPRAAEIGDARALPYLRALVAPKYVRAPGHYRAQDVYGCLHAIKEPAKTIAKIEARSR